MVVKKEKGLYSAIFQTCRWLTVVSHLLVNKSLSFFLLLKFWGYGLTFVCCLFSYRNSCWCGLNKVPDYLYVRASVSDRICCGETGLKVKSFCSFGWVYFLQITSFLAVKCEHYFCDGDWLCTVLFVYDCGQGNFYDEKVQMITKHSGTELLNMQESCLTATLGIIIVTFKISVTYSDT